MVKISIKSYVLKGDIKMGAAYLKGGVKIEPMPPSNGSLVEVSYMGKLAESNSITLNVGYGEPNNFFKTQKISMDKSGNEFLASFTVEASDRMNMFFEDANGSRDDNNGSFYQAVVDSENLSYG